MSAETQYDVWMEAMRKAGYNTQTELAQAANVSNKTLGAWIRGTTQPSSLENAEQVADLLYLDVKTLFPDFVPASMRRYSHTPFGRALIEHGYHSMTEFSDKAHVEYHSAVRWAQGYAHPRNDQEMYYIAGLLDAAPTDLFPDWQPCESPIERRIYELRYHNIAQFAQAARIPASRVYGWISTGNCPEDDAVALRVAEMLKVEPTELWPEWKPREEKKNSKPTRKPDKAVAVRYTPRADHGLNEMYTPIKRGMDDMRRNANVWVGKRFVMHYPTKEGAVNRPGTVVECGAYWFRIKYDAGWCECFHYQCRIDQTEGKHFRKPAQNA